MRNSNTPSQSPIQAAIYTRISSDRRGTALGVQRQQEACRELAERNGWQVMAVLEDNDLSAYSGKHRPAYARLLELMETGQLQAVVALHTDRLHRSPMEMEKFIDICDRQNISVATVQAGPIDLSTASGRMGARVYSAVARHEVEHAIERQRAAKLQAAKAGKPSGGTRPYGYEQNGMVIIEEEAAIVREVIDRFIAGDSWRTIAIDLNSRDIPTAKGHKWTPINVRNVAVRPRNVGIRVHNDDQYPAAWHPLVSQDTWQDLQLAIKRGQAVYGQRGTGRRHLLSGFVYCGICDQRMHIVNSATRGGDYVPAFACRKYDINKEPLGCGKLKRRMPPLEELVIDAVMYRLNTPRLVELMASSKSAAPELKQLIRERDIQAERLNEILDLYSTGELDFSEYKTAKASATAHLEELDKQIADHAGRQTLVNIPAGQTVQEAWDKSDLKWRRELLDTLIEKIYIDPRQPGKAMPVFKGKYRFDPNLIRIVWRA